MDPHVAVLTFGNFMKYYMEPEIPESIDEHGIVSASEFTFKFESSDFLMFDGVFVCYFFIYLLFSNVHFIHCSYFHLLILYIYIVNYSCFLC